VTLIERLAAGDPAAPAELVAAVDRWGAQAGHDRVLPLHRYLHLPPTPAKYRQALRDAHLRRAAALLLLPADALAWDRAGELLREIGRFRRSRQWRRWQLRVEIPDDEGTPLQRELATVLRLGARLPKRGRLRDVLLDT